MSRLRWRLAQLVAGTPIIRDPGAAGVFIVLRGGPVTAVLTAQRFRLKSTGPRTEVLDVEDVGEFIRMRERFVSFVGTVAR